MSSSKQNDSAMWRLVGVCTEGGESTVILTPPNVVSLGRAPERTIHLVQKQVSRLHAEFHWVAPSAGTTGHWRIKDCGSSFGTRVNGTKLAPQQELRVDHADTIEIKPWIFRASGPESDRTVAEGAQTIVAGADSEGEFEALAAVQSPAELAQGMLVHIYAATEELFQATDEREVGQGAVDALSMATGFANVAFLRPGSAEGACDLIAHTGEIADSDGATRVSRSLLKRARNGIYVHRGGAASGGTLEASLASLSIRQAIVVPIETDSVFHGWLYLDNRTGSGEVSHEDEAVGFASAVARLTGLSLNNIARVKMQQRFKLDKQEQFESSLNSLIKTIDARDPYTKGHSDRVAEFAALLAGQLKMSAHEIERVRLSGQVHDIGKIGVPDAVLLKPSRLDKDEFAKIREHPERGANILSDVPQMRDIIPGVLEHHERWDGGGYPKGLKGEAISSLGRILCVADSFDAMTSARTYRPARPIGEVREEVRKCLGTHFDPEIGQAFLAIKERELESRIAKPVPAPVSA